MAQKQAEALVACLGDGTRQEGKPQRLDMGRALDVARVMTDNLEGVLR